MSDALFVLLLCLPFVLLGPVDVALSRARVRRATRRRARQPNYAVIHRLERELLDVEHNPNRSKS